MTLLMTSQRIFNANNIAKNINSLLSCDPISGKYILQATVYVNYVHRLHDGLLFYVVSQLIFRNSDMPILLLMHLLETYSYNIVIVMFL